MSTKTETIAVHMTVETKQQIKLLAQAEGRSMGAYIHKIITDVIRQTTTLSDFE